MTVGMHTDTALTNEKDNENEPGFQKGMPQKKKIYKQWWLWLVVALVVIGIGLVGYNLYNHPKMPDLAGKTPFDAEQQLEQLSNSWNINLVTDGGDSVEAATKNDYSGYDVKSTNPAPQTKLTRNSDQKIDVVIQKNAETLALETKHKPVLDGFIKDQKKDDDFKKNGVTYADEGNLVTVNIECKSVTHTGWHDTPPEQRDAEKLAADLKTNVLILRYRSDGYLAEINKGFYAGYDKASDEDKKQVAKRIDLISKNADKYAKDNRTKWFEGEKAFLKDFVHGPTGKTAVLRVEYDVTGDCTWINVHFRPSHYFGFKDKKEKKDETDFWQDLAAYKTRCLRTNVGYKFIEGDGKVDLKAYAPMKDYEYKSESKENEKK